VINSAESSTDTTLLATPSTAKEVALMILRAWKPMGSQKRTGKQQRH
jgi:hypothetical protein